MKRHRYTFAELQTVARKYYPDDSNYCTVIALCIAADLAFGKAAAIYRNVAGRVKGKGTYRDQQAKALAAVGLRMEHVQGCRLAYWPTTMSQVPNVFKSMPGVYFVYTSGHVAAVRDGVVEDWTQGRRHRVKSIYQIVPL